MARSFPSACLRTGAVFCSAATWWVLVARQEAALVFCPILAQTENHHRADLPLLWAEALQAGCPDGTRIRCRPVLRASIHGLTYRGQLGACFTERLVLALTTELRHRQREDRVAPRLPKNAPSCRGALSLPPLRPESRSPRALHFF